MPDFNDTAEWVSLTNPDAQVLVTNEGRVFVDLTNLAEAFAEDMVQPATDAALAAEGDEAPALAAYALGLNEAAQALVLLGVALRHAAGHNIPTN